MIVYTRRKSYTVCIRSDIIAVIIEGKRSNTLRQTPPGGARIRDLHLRLPKRFARADKIR